jgi:hypothetical protein
MPRNSSGTYSLPSGNPVAPNTLIETSWANPTMADLGAGITDSLDRNGRGSMLAQLKLTDGTVAAPGFAFTSETTTGMYRAAANTLAFAVAGVLAMSMNATTIAFNKTVSFTNAVAFPQGTAGAPGVAFSLDLDTGMWSPGADAIAWSTGGVERMRLSSAGLSNQLGAVGTPSYSFTGDLDTGMWSPGADILALSTAGAERLRLDASGRVGIGTSSPQRPLHIAGTEPAMVLQETDQAADQQRWRVYSAGATFAIDAVNDAFSGAQVGYQMVRGAGATVDRHLFSTGGTERMRIDASGNVGIGGSPSFRLHVIAASSNAILMAQSSDASGVQAYLQANSSTDARVGTLSNVPLLFIQNTAERMRIDTAGNVGIGGVPTTKLDVFNGNVRMTDSYSLVWGDSSTYISGSAATDIITLTTAGAERVRVDSAGRVGIAKTPSYLLDVNGTAAALNWVIGLEQGNNAGTTGFTNANGPGIQYWGSATANAGALLFLTGNAERMRITAAGVIQDAAGLELGYRNIPRVDQSGGSAAASIRGKAQGLTSTAAYTIPSGVFTAGDSFSIINFNAGAVSIAQGAGLTMRLAGSATTGSRTLAGYGVATVWFANGAECWISGAGVT